MRAIGCSAACSQESNEEYMILAGNSDREWQKWGKTNPYFGVLTDPKYLNENLNDDSLKEFFASGESHIEHVYSVIREKIRPDFHPAEVLDYGCGVGRLVVPLSKRSQKVIGIDVSQAMLEQARNNCKRLGIASTRLLHVDEMETLAPASLDLIHSFIVFQHIPTVRGEFILRKLLALLAEGGVGAIHMTYADPRSALRRGISALRLRIGPVHGLLNLARHRPYTTPLMQMNSYSMNRIFDILYSSHCSNLHVEFTNHYGHHGAMLYFEKRPSSQM
jgi:SAM-dependent methyltransferase